MADLKNTHIEGNLVVDGKIRGQYNDIYSTTEQRIGTWINGEPLYRIVLTGTFSTRETRINVSSLNIDNIIDIRGGVRVDNDLDSVRHSATSTAWNVSTNYNIPTTSVVLKGGSSITLGGAFHIILEYTKSSI